MNTVAPAVFLIVCLLSSVDAQGGRGGGGRGGGGYRPSGRGSSCKGDHCASSGVIVGSIVGGILGLCLLIAVAALWIKHRRGRPSQPNVLFIKTEATKNDDPEKSNSLVFTSGSWKSLYFQYGDWHGPYQLSLTFDSQSMTVKGAGSDDIGTFTIEGVYSTETGRLALTKTYIAGTGNTRENLGHQVTIQLTWNAQNNQFEGKWYVQTSKYHGEDKFQLRFDGHNAFTIYEKV